MLTTMSSDNYIKESSKKNDEPEWLLKKRLDSYNSYKNKPMPSFIYGLNISLNIELNLSDLDISKSGKPIREIINNNDNVEILEFKEAIKKDFIKEKLMSLLESSEKFTSFHNAFFDNLLVVYVPKNTVIKETIEIITKVNSEILFDHLMIIVEDNSSLSLIENIESENDNEAYLSKIVEIFVGNNSKVNYGSLQTLNKNTFNFVKKIATTKRNSIINWLDCCFGGLTTSSEVTTNLNGEGSETNNHGIFFGNEKQQFDLSVNSIHNAANTTSDIISKGALTDYSKCIYHGLVKIQRNATGSNGYQKDDTLLLSPNAVADAIPDLEIDNGDVKCSHGATIGRTDIEKMFYLKTRGFDEKEATKMYVKGFFNELINKMKIKKLRENMQEIVEERMN